MSRRDFDDLYDACAQQLLVFFARRAADPHTARDLWAETLAQAFAARGRFRGRGPEQARSWLYGIAYRQLGQYRRRGVIEQRALRRLALEAPALSDEDVERLDELAHVGPAVSEAMHRLPMSLRDALALRVLEELPYAEVATRLNITPGAARVRVSRALSALRAAATTDRKLS